MDGMWILVTSRREVIKPELSAAPNEPTLLDRLTAFTKLSEIYPSFNSFQTQGPNFQHEGFLGLFCFREQYPLPNFEQIQREALTQ